MALTANKESFLSKWEWSISYWQGIYSVQRITEWFDEYGNDINAMLWPFQSANQPSSY